jgi:hypothetical protein
MCEYIIRSDAIPEVVRDRYRALLHRLNEFPRGDFADGGCITPPGREE